MSAELERIFSGGRRTVLWSRCSLSPSTIERLECLKHWIRTGLDDPVEGEEDEELQSSEPAVESEEGVWEPLTFENLEKHARLLAESEVAAIDSDEIIACNVILLYREDYNSEVFRDGDSEGKRSDEEDED